jgi:hypothetical protein
MVESFMTIPGVSLEAARPTSIRVDCRRVDWGKKYPDGQHARQQRPGDGVVGRGRASI